MRAQLVFGSRCECSSATSRARNHELSRNASCLREHVGCLCLECCQRRDSLQQTTLHFPKLSVLMRAETCQLNGGLEERRFQLHVKDRERSNGDKYHLCPNRWCGEGCTRAPPECSSQSARSSLHGRVSVSSARFDASLSGIRHKRLGRQ